MLLTGSQGEASVWEVLLDEVQTEMDQTRRELKEIDLMIKQSQAEVDKLVQRNASISMHIQQVHTHIDTTSPEEIRSAYEAAMETQQRLLVMRGQIERLQSDNTFLTRYINFLERVNKAVQAGPPTDTGEGGGFGSVEMMIQAQEAERRRLSRQMHDGPAQALSNFILQTEIAMRLFDMDQVKAREELENLKETATSTFKKVRDFIFDLRPMMLDDLGLSPTVKRYAEAFKDQTGLDVNVTITGVERRLEGYIEVMIFRAIQEMLSNIAQHAQATQVKVQLDITDREIKVIVEDDGKGFDVEELEGHRGLGLKLIRERVQMLGGTFDIDSKVGKGSRVIFQLPSAKTAVFV
ncbi:MAG: ATP-binding protein [Chloroflexota bacterium]